MRLPDLVLYAGLLVFAFSVTLALGSLRRRLASLESTALRVVRRKVDSEPVPELEACGSCGHKRADHSLSGSTCRAFISKGGEA